MAGALSQWADVTVTAPGPPGSLRADGLFDVRGLGEGLGPQEWPEPAVASWPTTKAGPVVVDGADHEAVRLARALVQSSKGYGPLIPVSPGGAFDPVDLGVPVAVNPIAAKHPHNGFGFSDYLLILTDRVPEGDDQPTSAPPTALASWVIARYPRFRTVYVENAEALAYWGRCLRGIVHIDTRTDLQRLMAHSRMTIDLSPGRMIARECIESLQLGTPVIAPEGSAGGRLAGMGGGIAYSDVAELLHAVVRLSDPVTRDQVGRQGKQMATDRFGRTADFVAKLRTSLYANDRERS